MEKRNNKKYGKLAGGDGMLLPLKRFFKRLNNCPDNSSISEEHVDSIKNETRSDMPCVDEYGSNLELNEYGEVKTKEQLITVVEKLLTGVDTKVEKSGIGICVSELRYSITRDNDGILEIICFDRSRTENWYLILHVLQKNEEFGYNDYIKSGTDLEEIRSFLLSDEGIQRIFDSMYSLSGSVDEHTAGLVCNTISREKKGETVSKPELSSYHHIEGQPLIFTSADRSIVKPILDKHGRIIDFPGIAPWVGKLLDGSPGRNAGIYGSGFERYGDDGFILYWTVQPDGRYWEDEDGFGMTNDEEIVLFSIVGRDGRFTYPFRLHAMGNRNYYYGVDDCEPRPLFMYETRSTLWGRRKKNSATDLELSVSRCGNIYGELTIPERIGNFCVTEICMLAFMQNTGIRKINLPDSVDSIGSQVFDGCIRLEQVNLPEQIDYADLKFRSFNNCISLTSITIPSGVCGIGEAAFQGCKSLKSISLPEELRDYGNACFNGCDHLVQITLPQSIGLFLPSSFEGSPLFPYMNDIRSCADSRCAFIFEDGFPKSGDIPSDHNLIVVKKIPRGYYAIGKGFKLKCRSNLLCEIKGNDTGSYVVVNRSTGEKTVIIELPDHAVDGTDDQIGVRLRYRAKHIGLLYDEDTRERRDKDGIFYTPCQVKQDNGRLDAVIAVSQGHSLLIIGEVDYVSRWLRPA